MDELEDLAKEELGLRATISTAYDAKQALENPHYAKAFTDLRASLVDAMIASKADETEFRDDCHRCIDLLEKIQQLIREHVDSGTIADARLREILEQRQ